MKRESQYVDLCVCLVEFSTITVRSIRVVISGSVLALEEQNPRFMRYNCHVIKCIYSKHIVGKILSVIYTHLKLSPP